LILFRPDNPMSEIIQPVAQDSLFIESGGHTAPPITTATFLTDDPPLLVPCYGIGRDSTAMLIKLEQLGIRPAAILAADPGGEKRETYRYLDVINEWLRSVSFPEIIIVRKSSPKVGDLTLEDECLRTKFLPSIAYRRHNCSGKWKADPQAKFLNNWPQAIISWRRGRKVVRAVGYEATECKRLDKAITYIKEKPSNKFDFWYPLSEWGMDLDACIETIKAAGLPPPPKSACFFCSSSKKWEIEWLAENHPDLFLRALMLEKNAEGNNRTVKGLGINFAWSSLPCAEPFLEELERSFERRTRAYSNGLVPLTRGARVLTA
jgi:hypothetical protein